ncbi:MAG: ABC transporter permease [Actinomycetaceae bacterium]|nr:ABC transporter permease [Actinomycetaceae bacterium]
MNLMISKLWNSFASQARLMWFYVKQFASVSYFIQLMVISTVTVTFVQNMGVRAWGGDPVMLCNRSAIIGLWSTSIAAAGIIGFERNRGTLVHLLVGKISLPRVFFAIVSSASSFGLLAFPVAWTTWILLDGNLDIIAQLSFTQFVWDLGYIFLLWLGAVSVASVVASIFVLTPNAISYEQLLLVPVFILSGLLFTGSHVPNWIAYTRFIIPLGTPSKMLLNNSPASLADFILSTLSIIVWFALAYFFAQKAIKKATQMGTLEVI